MPSISCYSDLVFCQQLEQKLSLSLNAAPQDVQKFPVNGFSVSSVNGLFELFPGTEMITLSIVSFSLTSQKNRTSRILLFAVLSPCICKPCIQVHVCPLCNPRFPACFMFKSIAFQKYMNIISYPLKKASLKSSITAFKIWKKIFQF